MKEKPLPPIATRFKPGQSGNPSGKPKQLLTKDRVHGVLGRFADMTRDQLRAVTEDPKSTMLEIMIASIMVKAAKDGDAARMSFLLDRSIGRVKEELKVETVDTKMTEEQERLRAELAADPSMLEAAELLAARVVRKA